MQFKRFSGGIYASMLILTSMSTVPLFAQSSSPGGITGSGTLTLPKPPQSHTPGATLIDSQRVYAGKLADLLTFAITNNDKNPINYDFDSGKQFDIAISDASSNRVWASSNHLTYSPLVTHLRLKSGQSHTFFAVWKRVDDSGKPVLPGVYTVNAVLLSLPSFVVSKGPAINVNTATSDPTNVTAVQTGVGPNNTISAQDNEALEKDIAPSVSAKTTITVP